MTRGGFIALEGGEGVGKSTQTRLLADALRATGREVVVTREPGGTPGAEVIRGLLLGLDGEGWNPRAEALLFAAARSDHVERLIAPALAMGKWVICDRFIDSSRAYQGGAGALGDADVMALHRIGSGGLLPDLTLLFEASPAVSAERLARREGLGGGDRIEARGSAFHGEVARTFARIADAEPDRFVRIDSDGSREATHQAVMAAIAPLLAGQ